MRLYGMLIVTILMVSNACGQALNPFEDQNNIIGLSGEGEALTFRTSNGQKSLKLQTGLWSYRTDFPDFTPTPIPPYPQNLAQPQPQPPRRQYTLPDYFPKKILGDGGVVDAWPADHPRWMLIESSVDRGDIPPLMNLYLADARNKKAWIVFKNINVEPVYSRLWVAKDTVWIASNQDLTTVDLNTGKITRYLTYPLFPVIRNLWVDNKLYYLNPQGLFWVDRGVIHETDLNTWNLGGAEFNEMMADGKMIYLVGKSNWPQETPALGSKTRLYAYDTETQKAQSFPLVVPADMANPGFFGQSPLPWNRNNNNFTVVNHLLKIGGRIIGYGQQYLFDEEGFLRADGGAFSYTPGDKQLKVLTTIPISEVNLQEMRFVSEYLGDDTLIVTTLSFNPDLNKLNLVEQWGHITQEKQDQLDTGGQLQTDPTWFVNQPNRKRYYVDLKGEIEAAADRYNHGPESWEAMDANEKSNAAQLRGLQVQYETVSRDAGTAGPMDLTGEGI